MNVRHTSLLLTCTLLALFTACGPSDEDDNNASDNASTENNTNPNNTNPNNTNPNNTNPNNTNPNNVTPNNNTAGMPIEIPTTYSFDSRYEAGKTSVVHTGQTSRHALIAGLNDYISGTLENDAIMNTNFGSKDDFVAALNFYYEFDTQSNTDLEHTLSLNPANEGDTLALEPKTYIGLSSGAVLKEKFAGNDSVTDYKDWSTGLQGWEGQTSAEGLLIDLMDQLATQAYDLSQGTAPINPNDDSTLPVYVTPEGVDLKQMIQKYLLMGVTFAQATDDYLDDDVATQGKGLFAANTQSEGKTYTGLEHVWDEGIGYFGSAHNYSDYTDAQLSDQVHIDGDGDGIITISVEYNFGAAINAGKRDKGSADSAKTDYTQAIFDAFVKGRTLIVNAGEDVSSEDLDAIRVERDIVVQNWEKAIAATAVHYINDTLQEMKKYSAATGDYSHAEHAKVWSELKGFSLGFQFNPASPMVQGTTFADFHALLGNAPVLPSATEADFNQYKADLVAARDILKTAYAFDDANMGDADGENGW